MSDFVTALVPALASSRAPRFNVFDVMHHGQHEKQISNVFGWLLRPNASHGLGDRFVTIFIDQLNAVRQGAASLPEVDYSVVQEFPIRSDSGSVDVVDIVLEGGSATICIENYYTSDGHGHDYWAYLKHAQRGGRDGAVVLLCKQQDRSRLAQGWNESVVLTYNGLLHQLLEAISSDAQYRKTNADAYWFIEQMHRKFEEGTPPMSDDGLLQFVLTMCDTGEARRYREQPLEDAAQRFSDEIAAQARAQFLESREMLHRVKATLKRWVDGSLVPQFTISHGAGAVSGVTANWSGIYQWAANISFAYEGRERRCVIMFGPTAWHANNGDVDHEPLIDPAPNYSYLLLGRMDGSRILRQSRVLVQEVLDGLDPDDARLHEEITALLA